MPKLTLSGTTPEEYTFKAPANYFAMHQVSGADVGTVEIQVRLLGSSDFANLAEGSNIMDLTDVRSPVWSSDQAIPMSGIRLTPAGLSGDVEIQLAADVGYFGEHR